MMTIGYERQEKAAIEKDIRIVPMLNLANMSNFVMINTL